MIMIVDLIRDYEGQIAMLKMRIELLEQQVKDRDASLRIAYGSPERMLANLQIAGFPAIDIKTIYETLDEWHREGGSDGLIAYIRDGGKGVV